MVKDVNFIWDDACQNALDDLKLKLFDTPILRGPNWTLPFHISTNAYHSALGVLLGQKEGQQHYAIYFINKNLTPAKLNYAFTEKEFLAVIYAINKFHHYITGYDIFIHKDHSAIRYLMNKPITNGRITRWILLMQEFNVNVIDQPHKENQVADFLSRLNTEGVQFLMNFLMSIYFLYPLIHLGLLILLITLLQKNSHNTYHPRKSRGLSVLCTLGWWEIFTKLDLILLFSDVLERMKCMTFLNPTMMVLVGSLLR